MALKTRLLLIVLDGLPWRNWKKFMGNLEGWVQSGDARVWKMRSVLPSTSACCYASIHTGVPPQAHGILSNEVRFRVTQPDVFAEVVKAGGKTGAVTHSYWSEFFNRYPFDMVRDIEYDEPDGPITPWPFSHHDWLRPFQPDDAIGSRPLRHADNAGRAPRHRLRHPAHLYAGFHGPPLRP